MTSIYVGNLAHDATDDDLREAFGQFGQVSQVNIIKDRETGRPRGFAFVEMPDNRQAAIAMQALDLQPIAGRPITVNEARPRTERARGRGGFRRG